MKPEMLNLVSPILAALISGIVAYIGYVMNKQSAKDTLKLEEKTSSDTQIMNFIDQIRSDNADLRDEVITLKKMIADQDNRIQVLESDNDEYHLIQNTFIGHTERLYVYIRNGLEGREPPMPTKLQSLIDPLLWKFEE